MTTEREKALELAIGQIEKRFGKGSIMKLGESATLPPIAAIPTGSLALDLALGIGGIPRGRITEIFGPESSGKTTLAQHIIAEAQKRGGTVAYIDAEHAMDPSYAANCGVNVDDLLISQPDTGEQALEIAEALIRSSAVDVIVIDSVAALVPRAEIEGEMGDAHVGLQARLMSQALRKLAAATGRSGTALIFINQLRVDPGQMFGNPEGSPGGRALKHACSLMVNFAPMSGADNILKDGNDARIGHRVRAKVLKNKVAPAHTQCEYFIEYLNGVVRKEEELLTVGDAVGYWERPSARTYMIGGVKCSSRQDALDAIKENMEFYERDIREHYIEGGHQAAPVEEMEEVTPEDPFDM